MTAPRVDAPAASRLPIEPVGEAIALLTAAAAEHESAGRDALARAHLARARRLVEETEHLRGSGPASTG